MKYVIGIGIGIGVAYFYPSIGSTIIETVKEVYYVINSKF
jgi:hypothetical protein